MPKVSKAKKLVLVSAISTLVTGANKKAQVIQTTHNVVLNWVLCIHYLEQFQQNKEATIWALINSTSGVNAMTPAYVKKLGLYAQRTNVKAEKIDKLSLNMFEIVIRGF